MEANNNTPQKLTAQETETLSTIIAKAVLENIAFPSHAIGGVSNNTIQELIHNKNVDQLKSYGEFIEKTFYANKSSFADDDDIKSWGSITVHDLISFIKLVIKLKKFETSKVKRERELKKLQAEMDNLKTPEERRKELEERIKSLSE